MDTVLVSSGIPSVSPHTGVHISRLCRHPFAQITSMGSQQRGFLWEPVISGCVGLQSGCQSSSISSVRYKESGWVAVCSVIKLIPSCLCRDEERSYRCWALRTWQTGESSDTDRVARTKMAGISLSGKRLQCLLYGELCHTEDFQKS